MLVPFPRHPKIRYSRLEELSGTFVGNWRQSRSPRKHNVRGLMTPRAA